MSKNNENQPKSQIFVEASIIELLKSRGINSSDTTNEHLGETKLVFWGTKVQSNVESEIDDSVGASIRFLNRKKSS